MDEFVKMCDCPEVRLLLGEQPRLDQIIAMLPEGWWWERIGQTWEKPTWCAFVLCDMQHDERDGRAFHAPSPQAACLQAVMYARHGKRWDAERKVWE